MVLFKMYIDIKIIYTYICVYICMYVCVCVCACVPKRESLVRKYNRLPGIWKD